MPLAVVALRAARYPIAVLLSPVVKSCRALTPIAVLRVPPASMFSKVPLPKPTFEVPVGCVAWMFTVPLGIDNDVMPSTVPPLMSAVVTVPRLLMVCPAKVEVPAAVTPPSLMSKESTVTPDPELVSLTVLVVITSPEETTRFVPPEVLPIARTSAKVSAVATWASTYALIDCCVESAVALLEDMLSSSRIDVTETLPRRNPSK